MTDKIKSAIEELELTRDIFFPKDISMNLAIHSLKAWEKVLERLKHRRDYYNGKNHTLFVETNACINIIESLLAEIEE